jgi:crotonobetainyl-CoA:carnitine CoA-transferase CaiB-like acyl-CoA transferase
MRVIDLSRGIAGAYCAQLLALTGCDVVRINYDGRDERIEDVAWACVNRGKTAVQEEHQDRLVEVLAGADALVEDRGPGGIEALGLDEANLRGRRPNLIITRVSEFGQSGPWAGWSGSELVNLAAGGMLFLTGSWDRPPMQLAPYQAQLTTGLLAAIATAAALYGGEGVTIDASKQEAVLALVNPAVTEYAYSGTIPAREGTVAAMPRIELSKDGWVYAGPGAAATADYETFSRFLELPELAEERFATPEGRMANWEEHQRLVLPKLKERTTEEWLERAEEWRLTFGPVETALELLEDDVLNERGFFAEMPLPAGTARAPLAPYLVDAVRPDAFAAPPPATTRHDRNGDDRR